MDCIAFTFTADVKFELVAMCCLIIAGNIIVRIAKFDENDPMIPDYKDILTIYPKTSFSLDNFKKYESLCLKALGYKLRYFTAYHFVIFLSNCGYVFSNDIYIPSNSPQKVLTKKKSNSAIPSVNVTISNNAIPFEESNSSLIKMPSSNSSSLEKLYDHTKDLLSFFIEGIQIVLRRSSID
jgi:hypothetical protein